MRRKFLALVVALLFVSAEPAAAQAIQTCSSSQNYVIASAQRQVSVAQFAVTAAQGYVRGATASNNSSQSALRAASNNLNNINKQINALMAKQNGANRVALLDLQVAVERLNRQVPAAERGLNIAQAAADQSQKYLDLQSRRLSDAQDNVARRQSELQRQQSKCSP
jgi:chromosome segregation ATPase